MDLTHIERLKEEQQKGLEQCNTKIAQWKKYKEDYIALKNRLQTLPDKTVYDIMVPFGSLAFMPGQLIHTNEILVLLGDNWFAECSAKQSCEIIDRRIKEINKNLEVTIKEKKLFEDYLGFTSEIAQEKAVDIHEEYDEEKEQQWKAQRRKTKLEDSKISKLLEYKKNKLDEEEFEKKLWARLDELEQQEEDLDEFAKMSSHENLWDEETEQECKPKNKIIHNNFSLIDILEEKEMSTKKQSLVEDPICSSEKVSDSETKEKKVFFDGLQKPVSLDLNQKPLKRKVTWKNEENTSQEEEELIETEINDDLTYRITFKHSPSHKDVEPSVCVSSDNSTVPFLQSPSDIYKLFGSTSVVSKSILKSPKSYEESLDKTTCQEFKNLPIKPSSTAIPQPNIFTKPSSTFIPQPNISTNSVPLTVVSEAVIERNVSDLKSSNNDSISYSKKSVSKFKASRNAAARR